MLGTYLLYLGSFLTTALSASKSHHRPRLKNQGSIGGKVQYIIYILAISFVPIFLASIRKGIGIDYSTYEIIFAKAKNNTLMEYYASANGNEIGNYFLIKIGYFLFANTQGVFALYAILTFGLLVASVLYYRNRISVFMGIMVMFFLYYTGGYNVVRQYLAMAIVVFALRFIEQRKFTMFFIFVVLATSIHSTAFIMLFVYFLYEPSVQNDGDTKMKMRKFRNTFMMIVLIFFPVFMSAILNLISIIPIFTRYFEVYNASSYDITASVILKLPVYIPLLLAYRKNTLADERNKLYYILLVLEFELLLTSTAFKWGFRLSYYAIFSQVILVAYTVKNTANRKTKLIIGTYFFAWYAIQFWILYFVWGRDAVVPYINIFM